MPRLLKPQWFQILLALSRGPMHGSAVMEEVLERTDGAMKLWPATLYGSFRDLEDAGWIEETPPDPEISTEGGRPRFYALTGSGETVLRGELDRLREILRVARERNLIADPDPRPS